MVHLRCFNISDAKGSPAAPCRPCNVEQVETHCLAPFQPQYSALWITTQLYFSKHWDYYKQRSQEDEAKVDIGHHRCHHIFLQLFFTVKVNDRILLQSCPIEHLAVMPHCLCKEWVTREQALHFQSNKIDWQLVLFKFATERVSLAERVADLRHPFKSPTIIQPESTSTIDNTVGSENESCAESKFVILTNKQPR